MTEPQLTPEQTARLDKLGRRWFWASVSTAGAAWLLFAAAIWFGSWRTAGIAALVTVLSAVCLVVAVALHHKPGRERAAEKLNTGPGEAL